MAGKQIERVMSRFTDDAKVEVLSDHKAVVYVPREEIAKVIGREGKTIEAIERKVGIHIDVQELEEGKITLKDMDSGEQELITIEEVIQKFTT